jgi:hypothetical protein
MSVRVELEALRDQIDSFGPQAFVVTVSPHGTPHVVSAVLRLQGDQLAVEVGRTSRANAAAHPAVTLLWSPGAGGEYSLIVDGTAEVGGDDGDGDAGTVTIEPTAAVLHRIPGALGDGPGCVPVLPRD